MTHSAATAHAEAGKEILQFGKWKGTAMVDIPQMYKDWAAKLRGPQPEQLDRLRTWAREEQEAQRQITFGHHQGIQYRQTTADLRQWARAIPRPMNKSVKQYQEWVMKQEWTSDQGPEWDIHHRHHMEMVEEEQLREWTKAWQYLAETTERQQATSDADNTSGQPPRKRGRIALMIQTDTTGRSILAQQWIPGGA